MKEALPFIFLLGAVIALVAAAASLVTPRAAIFFRKKTRLRGLFTWLGLALVCFMCVGIFAPEKPGEQAKAEKAAARAEADAKAEAKKPRLVPYREAEVGDTSVANRKRGEVRIVLADPGADFTAEQLAATCMAAAKFYAREYDFKTVSVFFTDIPGERPYEGTQVARCHYAPDKKGFGAGEGWEWNDVRAAERPYTDQERQVKQLWGELAARGMKGDAAIQKAIGKQLGIPAEKVATPPYILGLREVDERPFKDVKPQGPEQ